MEQAGVIAIAIFMIGVVYWSGWIARGVAEHERRISDLEVKHSAILTAIDDVRSYVRREGA